MAESEQEQAEKILEAAALSGDAEALKKLRLLDRLLGKTEGALEAVAIAESLVEKHMARVIR